MTSGEVIFCFAVGLILLWMVRAFRSKSTWRKILAQEIFFLFIFAFVFGIGWMIFAETAVYLMAMGFGGASVLFLSGLLISSTGEAAASCVSFVAEFFGVIGDMIGSMLSAIGDLFGGVGG